MKNSVYIAYGSNMDEVQMELRCPDSVILGKGYLKNWRLMFKGSKTGAYATIERKKGFVVPVILWTISVADEANLDRYEGFPRFYYKRRVRYEDAAGGAKMGMAYIMHEERVLGEPSVYYYKVLEDAYKKFGFDLEILDTAYEYSTCGRDGSCRCIA
ncbi:MAG: gamma-glutamylcyclotransferase [Selenomonadaceae bacterium]|nr:gamma-glutamylcyclotransferase [Selenomonadaceae bacterium]